MSADAVEALANGSPCSELNADEQIGQRFTLELVGERKISASTCEEAEAAFGREGVVAMTYLAGIYGITCTLLKAFEVPAPSIE